MVTINLNVRYDLLPEHRYIAGKCMSEYELERDIIEHCIIPAIKHYMPDIEKKLNNKQKKAEKKRNER